MRPINKKTHNTLRSRGALPSFLKKNCLDEDISVTLLEQTLKTQGFQIYKYYNVASLSPKCVRVQYEKD